MRALLIALGGKERHRVSLEIFAPPKPDEK